MATSGTTAFDLSIEEIIQEAYERCGMTTTSGHSLNQQEQVLIYSLQNGLTEEFTFGK